MATQHTQKRHHTPSTTQTAYRRYRQSEAWRHRRLRILARAGNRCEMCGRRAGQVHHDIYRHPWGTERDTDLRALCGPCHRAEHSADGQARKWAARENAWATTVYGPDWFDTQDPADIRAEFIRYVESGDQTWGLW